NGWNFLDNTNNHRDVNGHGTAVASVIAATQNNNQGGAGIAPDVKIMSLKVLGTDASGREQNALSSDITLAMEYARSHGAKIINVSLSGPSPDSSQSATINTLERDGVLVVAAAGNASEDLDSGGFASYPAGYGQDNIISVAASNRLGRFEESFSNFGKNSVDLAAPGLGIFIADLPRSTTFTETFNGSAWSSPQGSGAPQGPGAARWSTYKDAFDNYWLTDSTSVMGVKENYKPNTEMTAIGPTHSLLGLPSPKLRFVLQHALAQGDRLYIGVMSNGNTHYLDEFTGYGFAMQYEYLLPIEEMGDEFRVFFHLSTDGAVEADGVYIDDVEISFVDDVPYLGDEYSDYSGTSFSSPVVAGVAALVWSINPSLTYRQVKEILLSTVDQDDSLNSKVLTGGKVNALGSVYRAKYLRPGEFRLGVSQIDLLEGTSNPFLDIIRDKGRDTAVSLDYAPSNGSAKNLLDYSLASGSLQFKEGERLRKLNLNIIDDAVADGDKSFFVNLNQAHGATLSANNSVLINIIDDDVTGEERFVFDSSYRAVQESNTVIPITIRRLGDTSQSRVLTLSSDSSSATMDSDFNLSTPTIEFLPGQTAKTFNVILMSDLVSEGNEFIQLAVNLNGEQLDTFSTIEILDDEASGEPSKISFTQRSFTVNEGSGKVFLTLKREQDGGGPVTVSYSIRNGTAREGQDFRVTDQVQSVTLLENVTQTSIEIQILNDAFIENPVETFFVSLFPSDSCVVCEAQININDDDAVRPKMAPIDLGTSESTSKGTITIVDIFFVFFFIQLFRLTFFRKRLHEERDNPSRDQG
ncbi:MAG: S8 family serine peptidase, partial [Gammaproteobacteria bacterium]|nr:S8 family serine peptidase [Gammaproteobacteria bacterium]